MNRRSCRPRPRLDPALSSQPGTPPASRVSGASCLMQAPGRAGTPTLMKMEPTDGGDRSCPPAGALRGLSARPSWPRSAPVPSRRTTECRWPHPPDVLKPSVRPPSPAGRRSPTCAPNTAPPLRCSRSTPQPRVPASDRPRHRSHQRGRDLRRGTGRVVGPEVRSVIRRNSSQGPDRGSPLPRRPPPTAGPGVTVRRRRESTRDHPSTTR